MNAVPLRGVGVVLARVYVIGIHVVCMNICRTLGADLVRFCASLRVLFCTILQGDVFANVQKASIYWAFRGAAGKD